MNRRQFVRLFAVAFFPLLLLGFIAANIIFDKSGGKYAYILCAPFGKFENCRPLGEPNKALYESVKNEHPAWFDVFDDRHSRDSPLSNFIMASRRTVRDAVIVKATPFAGYGADVSSSMKSLVGKRTQIELGIKEGEQPSVYRDGARLLCNNLFFSEANGEYTSQCYGNGWGGPLTYKVTGQSRDELEKLQTAISEIVSSRENDYFIYRAVMYPMFIYLFLLVSLLAWGAMKAARYVRAG